MSPVDASQLEKSLEIIRARRGNDAIRRGSESPQVEKIPLDSPALMRITEGGIPMGHVSRLWGEPSSGKTHVAYLIIAAAQKYRSERFPEGLETAYWNVEGIWDAVHAASLGVDIDRMLLEEVKVIEDIAREMELLLGSCHLHVIDSTSSAKATDMLASDADDWHRALEPRAWGRALDRIEASFDGDENALILIDHSSRDMQTKAEYAKGGKRLDYANSMGLQFKKGGWLFYHPEDGHLEKADKIKGDIGTSPSGLKEPDGAEISVRVSKSRVCRPFRVAKLRLDFHSITFDTTFELLDAASFFDLHGDPAHRSGKPAIAQKTGKGGSWYQLPDGSKVQGDRGIRRRIEQDDELAQIIRRAMLAGS